MYISVMNVTVVGSKAVIDVSAQSPGAPNFPAGQAAPSGASAGQPGGNG